MLRRRRDKLVFVKSKRRSDSPLKKRLAAPQCPFWANRNRWTGENEQ